ncbi:MAG: MotA/TolQ/ExbB proton channel family protein [Planctomycetota bacterium]
MVQAVIEQLHALWVQAERIWVAGGWCMVPIAITALMMFALGLQLHLKLRQTGFLAVPERIWRGWIHHPSDRKGPIGELLDVVMGASSLGEIAASFREVGAGATATFARDLRLMKVCIGAAPLLGLLGTVTGMLSTFDALATGSGGEKTMALVARGIAEALITTETGLVIALPGVFFQYRLARKYQRYKAFLAHLETACTRHLYRGLQRVEAAS